MPGGRPSRLTPKVQDAFCKAIESGATQAMAEAHAGLGRNTTLLWLRKGREQKSGKYREFYLAFERARDKAGLRWLAKLQQLAEKKSDWRAYKWLLEVNFPHVYGPNADFESEDMQQTSAASRMLKVLLTSGSLDANAEADLMAGAKAHKEGDAG